MTRDTLDMFSDNSDRPTPSDKDKVKIQMVTHAEKPGAVLASTCGDINRAVWLPKSQTDITDIGPPQRKKNGRHYQSCEITMPFWLAREKGLV